MDSTARNISVSSRMKHTGGFKFIFPLKIVPQLSVRPLSDKLKASIKIRSYQPRKCDHKQKKNQTCSFKMCTVGRDFLRGDTMFLIYCRDGYTTCEYMKHNLTMHRGKTECYRVLYQAIIKTEVFSSSIRLRIRKILSQKPLE